jgi:hypothetical protein
VIETGRKYITPCCTAATVEYRDESGALFLRCTVAGHGWTSDYFAGSVDEINDTGTIVEADGTERSVHWKPSRDDVRSAVLLGGIDAVAAARTEGEE